MGNSFGMNKYFVNLLNRLLIVTIIEFKYTRNLSEIEVKNPFLLCLMVTNS